MKSELPDNLERLHAGEEFLRTKALDSLVSDGLYFNVDMIESTMNMLDAVRKIESEDEDLKLIQILCIRVFNAFASSLKLCFAGYYQNSAMILRDLLETTFLLDLFRTDRSRIAAWRQADKKSRLKEFKPIRVREKLDERDGFKEKKRAAAYDLFCELAGHPTMEGISMLRPRGMNAQIGPFFDQTAMQAVLIEAGKIAVQVGEVVEFFVSDGCHNLLPERQLFWIAKRDWMERYFSNSNEA